MEEDYPFYCGSHPQGKETEGKNSDIEETVRQFFKCVFILVAVFVLLGIAYGIFYFIRYH